MMDYRTYESFQPVGITDKKLLKIMFGFDVKKSKAPKPIDNQIKKAMSTGGVTVPQGQVLNEPAGPPSGVIGGENTTPQETVADNIPMEAPEGAFIINAAAAEVAGYGDIKKMIMDAVGVARRLGVDISTGDDKIGDEEAVDLLVSKGEVYIEPTLAKIIGYDRLEKINNRGKREVARRQKEAEAQQQPPQPPQPQMAQEGGFVKKKLASGDKITLYRGTAAKEAKKPIGTAEQRQKAIGTRAGSIGTWYTPDPNKAAGYARTKNDPIIRKIRVTFDEFLEGYLNAAKVHGDSSAGRAIFRNNNPKVDDTDDYKRFVDQARKMVDNGLEMVERGYRSPQEVAELLTEGVFPNAPENAKIAWKQTFSINPIGATKILAAGAANALSFVGSRAAGPVGLLFSTGLNEGEEEMLKELTAEDFQPKEDSQGFADGGYTRKDVAKLLRVDDEAERAEDLSRATSEEKRFEDNDKSEDTLRHILLGGLISPANQKGFLEKGLGFIAGIGADTLERERGIPFVGKYANEESRIDANNNRFGAALRKQYETQEEFEKAAIQVVLDLREGKPVKEINGLTPRLSLGN